MTPSPIELRHSGGVCRIEFVDDLAADPAPLVAVVPSGSRVFLLTETNVAPLWADRLIAGIEERGRAVERVVLPAGETSKTPATVSDALDRVLGAGIRRDDRVVALGGGVLGDEAGLVAALALRGVACIQVPTTLLAMVDSSIGGKTGVNHATGKNRIGVFSQPEAVFLSPAFLATLPTRELAAGLHEAVKAAFLAGREETELAARLVASGRRDPLALLPLVEIAVRLKVRVVEADERENGLRQILNLGHTLGHALESATEYRRFLHGEAVGWGLLAALRLSVLRGELEADEASRLAEIVEGVGERPAVGDLPFEVLEPFLLTDKKARSDSGSAWVVIGAPGRASIVRDVRLAAAREAWEQTRRVGGRR